MCAAKAMKGNTYYELWHWSQAAYVQIVASLPSIRETWKLLYIAKLQFPHT